jgi:hypothetical protein
LAEIVSFPIAVIVPELIEKVALAWEVSEKKKLLQLSLCFLLQEIDKCTY